MESIFCEGYYLTRPLQQFIFPIITYITIKEPSAYRETKSKHNLASLYIAKN